MHEASSPDNRPLRRRWTRVEVLLFVGIALLYFVMAGHFRTFNVDNPWFASFSYNYVHSGILTDTLMRRRFPHGMGGVEAFGKMPAQVQGLVARVFGWQLRPLQFLSTTFILAALALLTDAIRRLGKSPEFTACVLVVAGLFEPCLDAAGNTRYEFLAFFLLCLAMWCFSRDWIFLSALAAGISMEAEPIALVSFAVMAQTLLLTAAPSQRVRRLLRIALAGVCSAGLYVLLHPHPVAIYYNGDWSYVAGVRVFGGFAAEYLLRYKRHWLETAIFAAAIVCAVRSRRDIFMQWPAAALGTIFVLSAILRWNNPHYWVFAIPFLAFFLTDALLSAGLRWRWIIVAVALCTLPLDAYRYGVSVRRAPELTTADQGQIADAINDVAKAQGRRPEDLRVVANMNLYFAHPDHMTALDIRPVGVFHPIIGDVLVCPEVKLDPTLRDSSQEWKCSELTGVPADAREVTVHGYRFRVVALAGQQISPRMPDGLREFLRRRHATAGGGKR